MGFYKQKNNYGCGLYSIANVFDYPEFVTEERLKESIGGLVIGQLSKWLQEDGYDWSVDYWYYNHDGGKLPEWLSKIKPEFGCLASMFYVRGKTGSYNHMISGKIDKDGIITVYDSLFNEPVVVNSIEELNNMYDEVYGMCCFINHEDNTKYVMVN